MARDRTARERIRKLLATQGPIEHEKGKATATLMDAIGYQGNATAFIQLVAAMDRDGEIERETRGKRTYKISGVAGYPAGVRAGGAPESDEALDYDELARALLGQVIQLVAESAGSGASEEIAALRSERDELLADRARLQERLDAVQREALSTTGGATTEPPLAPPRGATTDVDARVRTLLAELVGERRGRAERTG